VEKQVQLADSSQRDTDLAVNVRYLTLLNSRESNLAALLIISGNYTDAQKEIATVRDLKRQRLDALAALKSEILSRNNSEKTAQMLHFENTLLLADAKDSEILALMSALPKTGEEQNLIVAKKTSELDPLSRNLLSDLDAIIQSNFAAAQAANEDTLVSLKNGLSALHVFSITTFLVVLLVVLFLNSLTINSISKISDAVEAVTKGRFDVELEQSNIYEIQALTGSFNRVLASMKLAILRTGMSMEDMGIGEALRAKKEAEDKYRDIYERTSDALMILEPPDWRFTVGNPATLKMFNVRSEAEFNSLTPSDLSPERQPDGQLSTVKARKMIEKAMKDGTNFFEWTHRKYKGEDFPATVLLTKMNIKGRDVLQAVVRSRSFAAELDEQLKGEKAFSETLLVSLKELLACLTEGVSIADEKQNISYMNPVLTNLFGKGAIGKNCFAVYKKQYPNYPLPKPIKTGETRSFMVFGIAGRGTFKITQTGILLPSGKHGMLEIFRKVDKKTKGAA